MKQLRTFVFWSHLAVGAVVAAIVVIMSATGVLLTYQKQMTLWADTRGLDGRPPQPGAARLPIESLLRSVERTTSMAPTAVTVRAGADAPVEVTLGRDRRAFVNAYTGLVLGDGSAQTRAFFRKVTAWHRTLGATGENRAMARSVTGAANLGFLFLVASGFYLWWPRNWTRSAVRNVTVFRRRLSGKARDFNWHHVIGFWTAVPLFIVVLSGVVISYPWASALVYRLAGERPPAPAQPAPAAAVARLTNDATNDRSASDANISSEEIDGLLATASAKMPGWKSITFTLPREGAKTVAFSLDRGTGGQPQERATLTLDRSTGGESKWEPFAAQTPGRQLRSILRFAHTGEVLGLTGQTIAGLVSLGSLFLAWTGIALALRRYASWRTRRVRVRQEEVATDGILVMNEKRDVA